MTGTLAERLEAAAYAIAGGAVWATAFWLFWSGRVRWIDGGWFGDFAATFLPGLAVSWTLAGVGVAIGSLWFTTAAMGLGLVGLLLWVFLPTTPPRWSRPGWWWEAQENATAAGRAAQTIEGGAAMVAQLPSRPAGLGEVLVESRALMWTGDGSRPAAVTVRGGRIGMVWVSRSGVVFRQGPVEGVLRGDEVAVDVPVGEVASVEVVRRWWSVRGWWWLVTGDARGSSVLGVVRVRSTTGEAWTWRVARPGRVVAAVEQVRAKAAT